MTSQSNLTEYDVFSNRMIEKFPKLFTNLNGGFGVGKGWWPVLESLCSQIQRHIDWKNGTREKLLVNNPYNITVPDQVTQVSVVQIKEKFGGLRFYYDGGDDTINGMVSMAEEWAAHSCEECGMPGKHRPGGWIRTLCDTHASGREI